MPLAGFVASEDLYVIALAVEILPGGGVLPGRVFRAAQIQRLKLADGGGNHAADVDARNGHRQQADGGEHAEAAADIVGHHKALPAVLIGQGFQHAAPGVGGGEDVFVGI